MMQSHFITEYGSSVYIGMALVWPALYYNSVLNEVLMITFSFWCMGLLTNECVHVLKTYLCLKMGKLYAQERC